MNLRPISLCTTELSDLLSAEYSEVKKAKLPPLAFHSVLVYLGSEKMTDSALDFELSPAECSEMFFSYYSDLGPFAWAKMQQLPSYKIFDHNLFCEFFHYRWHSGSPILMTALLSVPLNLQIFLQQKKAKLNDLRFLSSLETLSSEGRKSFFTFCETLISYNPSYQECLKALEMGLECLLLGKFKDLETLLKSENLTLSLLQRGLQQIRYPESFKIEQQKVEIAEKIPWPPFAQVKTSRRGDRVGYEANFFIASEADVIKTQAALERVREAFAQKEKTPAAPPADSGAPS